jgi:glycosyltransferase involved in cell wall biosynthesis
MLAEARSQGIHARSMTVLPMGVDLVSRFCPDPSALRDNDRLLFVGRLVAKKGVRHLLDAMPAVIAQRPAVRLGIAGFGPEEGALRRQADELGIAAHVDFLGAKRQADLPGLYRNAALFVAPFVRDASGDQEGLPVALMEAIGCGCPVLAGNVAGIHELLGSSVDEVAVDPEDTRQLSSRILEVLAWPERARGQAERRRLALGSKVDWQVIANGYADWIEASCLQTWGGRA